MRASRSTCSSSPPRCWASHNTTRNRRSALIGGTIHTQSYTTRHSVMRPYSVAALRRHTVAWLHPHWNLRAEVVKGSSPRQISRWRPCGKHSLIRTMFSDDERHVALLHHTEAERFHLLCQLWRAVHRVSASNNAAEPLVPGRPLLMVPCRHERERSGSEITTMHQPCTPQAKSTARRGQLRHRASTCEEVHPGTW